MLFTQCSIVRGKWGDCELRMAGDGSQEADNAEAIISRIEQKSQKIETLLKQ